MTYNVKIQEIHVGVITVEADNPDQAREQAERKYWDDPNAVLLEPTETAFLEANEVEKGGDATLK